MKLLLFFLVLTLGTAPDLWAGTVTLTNSGGKTTKSVRTPTTPGSAQRTTTFPDGSSSSSQSTFQGQGNGNYNGTIDRTSRKGSSQTYQVDGTIQRNGNTTTNKGTVTNQNGEIGAFDRQRTCTDRVCNGVNTYQTPQNNTYTKTYNSGCQNGTCTRDSTILGPGGKTTNVQTQADRVDQGTYSGTTTITPPQGQPRTSTFERTPNR